MPCSVGQCTPKTLKFLEAQTRELRELKPLNPKPSRRTKDVSNMSKFAHAPRLQGMPWVLEYYTLILFLVLGSYYSYLLPKKYILFFQGLLPLRATGGDRRTSGIRVAERGIGGGLTKCQAWA